MNNPAAREYTDKALSLARKRHQTMSENPPATALESMYGSIVEQLSYLRNIVDGSESDKTGLRKLTFGLYEVREFETSDEIFFQRLTDAFYIASQISSGLKVKLPHEVNDKYMQREQHLCKLYPDDFYI